MFGFVPNNSHQLLNFTNITFYGVNINNEIFIITPDDCVNESMFGFIFINTIYNFYTLNNNSTFNSKMYAPPTPGKPLYIPELGMVTFASDDERRVSIDKYGTGELLVEAYASKLLPLMNGSYKVTVSLSKKPFYTVVNKEIHELPIATDEYIQESMVRHGITKENLEGNDVFIIETVLRHSLKSKPNIIAHEIKMIKRDKINEREPIIFTNSGIIIFTNRRACEKFIEDYNGELENYLIEKAFEKVDDVHKKELEEYIQQTKSDKRTIVETFAIMGGTTLGSLVVENVVKAIIEKMKEKKDVETSEKKEIAKMFIGDIDSKAIGAGAIVIGVAALAIGGYFVYKHFKKKS